MMRNSDTQPPGPPQPARFAELVKLHTQGRRFLDSDREMKLLEEGVTRYTLSRGEAQATLRRSTEDAGVASQSELDRSTLQLLRTLSDQRGRIARGDFEKTANFYRGRAGTTVTETEARTRVKRLMEENDIEAKKAGFPLRTRRWYRAIEA